MSVGVQLGIVRSVRDHIGVYLTKASSVRSLLERICWRQLAFSSNINGRKSLLKLRS